MNKTKLNIFIFSILVAALNSCSLMPGINRSKIEENPTEFIPEGYPRQNWTLYVYVQQHPFRPLKDKDYDFKKLREKAANKYPGKFVFSDNDTIYKKEYKEGDQIRYVLLAQEQSLYGIDVPSYWIYSSIYDRKTKKKYQYLAFGYLKELVAFYPDVLKLNIEQ